MPRPCMRSTGRDWRTAREPAAATSRGGIRPEMEYAAGAAPNPRALNRSRTVGPAVLSHLLPRRSH